MNQPDTHWQSAGTQGLGVLVSDTMMFQRAQPQPSDPDLGSFYGLALPLLMRGIPVEPVQIESTYQGKDPAAFLRNYKLLLLTYEGQKPPSPRFHQAIVAWVKSGGALVVIDDDNDPYNRAHDWWNSGHYHLATPREDLFHQLGIEPNAQGLHRVGRGIVLYAAKSPTALTHDKTGAGTVRELTHQAADAIHLPWREATSLVLQRGPFVIAAGLDASSSNAPLPLHGTFINLFDPHLPILRDPAIKPDDRALLLNPKFFPQREPRILAASAKITDLFASASQISFAVSSIEGRSAADQTAIRLLLPKAPTNITVDGKPLQHDAVHYSDNTLLLEFPAHATAQKIVVKF